MTADCFDVICFKIKVTPVPGFNSRRTEGSKKHGPVFSPEANAVDSSCFSRDGSPMFLNQRVLDFMYLVISMDFPIRSMRTWLSKRLPPHPPVVTLSPYLLGLSHLSVHFHDRAGCSVTARNRAFILVRSFFFFLELMLA